MGCGMTKEKLQTDILVLQLEKAEIQEERERLIHQLEKLTRKKNRQKLSTYSNQSSFSQKRTSKCNTEETEK